MKWTQERLAALTISKRAQLYVNARQQGTNEGSALAELIEQAGLPFSEGGSIKMDDPLALAMAEVVSTPEVRDACVKAVEEGWPAIAGADPVLARRFTVDYGKHNMTTNLAGHLVADLMRSMGYRMVGRTGPAPKGCIARSGELWTKR